MQQLHWRTVSLLFVLMITMSSGFRLRPLIRSSKKLFSTESRNRISSAGISLDVNLIAANSELVMSHLNSRQSSEEQLNDVRKIESLRAKRNHCIVEGDTARNTRKILSNEIGKLMRESKTEEAAQLKKKVEESNQISLKAIEQQNEIDKEIEDIFSRIPNLLDDR